MALIRDSSMYKMSLAISSAIFWPLRGSTWACLKLCTQKERERGKGCRDKQINWVTS